MLDLVRRISNAVIKTWSSTASKKALWDREYSQGRWESLDTGAGDALSGYLEKYAAGGDILDLGCGAGNTARSLAPGAYRTYLGVDISEKAIEIARARSAEEGRSGKIRYVVADFVRYEPEGTFDVVLFRESLYYVPFYAVPRLIGRYARHLAPNGTFIIRLYHHRKFALTVCAIERNFRVVEKQLGRDGKAILIVFAPATRT